MISCTHHAVCLLKYRNAYKMLDDKNFKENILWAAVAASAVKTLDSDQRLSYEKADFSKVEEYMYMHLANVDWYSQQQSSGHLNKRFIFLRRLGFQSRRCKRWMRSTYHDNLETRLSNLGTHNRLSLYYTDLSETCLRHRVLHNSVMSEINLKQICLMDCEACVIESYN